MPGTLILRNATLALTQTVEHGWLYDWQTLIAGGAAVVAAAITAKLLYDQIGLEKKRIEDERCRKLRAARAILPGVLSEICNYADAAAKAVLDAWPTPATLYGDDSPPSRATAYTVKFVMPEFPPGAVQTMQTVMEHVNDQPVIDRISSIFREVQVLEARTRSAKGGSSQSLSQLSSHVQQAASLYARAATLFDFARNGSETIADGDLWIDVLGAFAVMNIHNRVVLQQANEERAAGLPPGEADTNRVIQMTGLREWPLNP